MNPHKFWYGFLFILISMCMGAWLLPGYFYQVDIWFMAMVGLLIFWLMVGYFWSEAHKGGYPLTTFLGHSATFNGSWAMEIAPTGNWPRMVAVPKGGGNYMGFPIKGGKRAGWLIVPKDHIIRMNGAMWANTRTQEIEPEQLPGHIYKPLSVNDLYRADSMIEFGLWPYEPGLDDKFKKMKGFQLEEELSQLNEEINNHKKERKALMKANRSLVAILESMGMGMSKVPPDDVRERVRRVVAGEDLE